MYEEPKLNEIGDAPELILGVHLIGYDFDGTNTDEDAEFVDDESI